LLTSRRKQGVGVVFAALGQPGRGWAPLTLILSPLRWGEEIEYAVQLEPVRCANHGCFDHGCFDHGCLAELAGADQLQRS